MTNTPENSVDTQAVAIVLASHGDRGEDRRNAGLATHVKALRDSGHFQFVAGGVLNGEPSLEQALSQAEQSGAKWILVYPMFMSAGYFASEELPRRIKAANLSVLTSILQPLGVDKRAPLLLLESALRAAKTSGIAPVDARLLIVGHGSKHGPVNADATRAAAQVVAEHSPFARIDTAFIEETPFVADALSQYEGQNVVAGFFSGDGMHSGEDIPDAISNSGAAAVYTGPVGLHPRVPELIVSSVMRALKSRTNETAPPQPAAAPKPVSEMPEAAPAPQSETRKKRSFLHAFSSGTRGLRLVLRAAVVLVMLAVLGIAALAFLVPEDTIREQVTSLVKQKTGRDLTIGGNVSLAWFPSIGVKLDDVRVSNPPGMKVGDTLRVGTLTVDLKLLPLISRRVEVDRFVLTDPVFNLLADAKGRKNWEIEKKSASRGHDGTARLAGPAFVRAQAAGVGGGVVEDVRLGEIQIVNGAVNFTDEVTGSVQNVSALNVSVQQPQLSEPLDANGDLMWRNKKIAFDARIDSVPALIRDKESKMRVGLTAPNGKADFDGQIRVGAAAAVSGQVSANTQSVRELINWVSTPLPPGGGLGAGSFVGQVRYKGDTLTFSNARLGIDGMTAKGQGNVRLGAAKPVVTASLAFDKLDLNPYLQEGKGSASQSRSTAPKPSAAGPAPKPQSGDSLTDFIKKLDKSGGAPQPQVRAWSQRKFDLIGLRAVNANVKLTTGTILYKRIKTGESAVTAYLNKGVLTADLTKLALYSGAGTGRVTLNSVRQTPAMAAVFNLKGVSARPLLKDAADFDWVSGRANIEFKLSGAGNSQKAMVQGLDGSGSFVFTDGAIEGINIPAMVRGLKQGKFDGWKRTDREKTDFSKLSASFVIQKGVAYNKDLQLIGPLLRLSGEGNVDLGRERVDYAALPRLVANLQGQGAVDDPNRGLVIPVRITGAWADPKIVPDLDRLLSDPELAKDAVEKVGDVIKKLKNKEDVNQLLQGLLGGGNQQAPSGAPQQGQPSQPGPPGQPNQQIRPEDVLRNLLGQ
ncbi:MAG: AsmA family protein [Hyphomicrobiaceae bacterium]|nr:AsmA family protein [Hyphomicrobiaceae bacterium]